jgi:ferric iron reductase protein FhuF
VRSEAEVVLAQVLRVLPREEHERLVSSPGAVRVPAVAILDPAWLREQLRLRRERWRTQDPRVLATLWWYAASVWLPSPALASLLVTGRALSPRLEDVTLYWWPDGQVTASASAAVLAGPDQTAQLGHALGAMFDAVIGPLAEAGGMRERPLWAIASDSLANRLLCLGRQVGDVDRATDLAVPLADAVGPRMPVPRFVDVQAVPGRPARFTRRNSCCLIYEAPDQDMCSSCPKLAPTERQARLLAAAAAR